MEKRKINLVIADDTEPREYLNFLSKLYNISLVKFADVGITIPRNDIDLVLFTGGEDVTPELYSQKKGKHTYCNYERDKQEKLVFDKLQHVPKLGICRGAQLLTILNGGSLIQHVSNHGITHTISIKGVSDYKMTSTHHQMMYPYNLKKENYDILGYSTYFQSNTYLNGDNEEKELPNNFLEPEIVYYTRTNSLCIQGHPEAAYCENNTRDICLQLIDNYLFNNKQLNRIEEESLPWEEPFVKIETFQDDLRNYEKTDNDYLESPVSGNQEDLNNLPKTNTTYVQYSTGIKKNNVAIINNLVKNETN